MISVVIPTRNRASTLGYCLETIMSQSYKNIQIVVSDNNSSDNTGELVRSLGDPRIKYVKSEESLSVNESFNFGLEGADGEFVTFIGDDDAFLPEAITYGMSLLQDKNYSALTWRKICYHWPNHRIPEMANILTGRSEPVIQKVDGLRKLKQFTLFREAYDNLPCVYNSIVKMSIIKKVRENSNDGLFFGGIIPDIYSGIAISPFIGCYLQALFPLSINGASSMSGGVLQGLSRKTREEEALISDITPAALSKSYHPDIGQSISIVSMSLGEYIIATYKVRNAKWPTPKWRRYVKALIKDASGSPVQDSIIESAMHTIRRRGLNIGIPKGAGISESNRAVFHFDGHIVVPCGLINNARDAAIFLGSLIAQGKREESNLMSYYTRKLKQLNLRTIAEMYRWLRTRCH